MARDQCVFTSATVLYVLVLVSFTPVSAWFFIPSDNIIARANGKPVDEGCEALGQAGACRFYRCFEDRLSCGPKGYMLRYGVPYCQAFERTLPAFTPQAQVFINKTSQCLMKTLLPYYSKDQVDCHRLSHVAFDSVSTCYIANGFCDVVQSNALTFIDVYKPRHLFQTGALKIWREIMEVTYQCDPEAVKQFARNAIRLISRIMSFFTSDDA